jgi:hypothetical protein
MYSSSFSTIIVSTSVAVVIIVDESIDDLSLVAVGVVVAVVDVGFIRGDDVGGGEVVTTVAVVIAGDIFVDLLLFFFSICGGDTFGKFLRR